MGPYFQKIQQYPIKVNENNFNFRSLVAISRAFQHSFCILFHELHQKTTIQAIFLSFLFPPKHIILPKMTALISPFSKRNTSNTYLLSPPSSQQPPSTKPILFFPKLHILPRIAYIFQTNNISFIISPMTDHFIYYDQILFLQCHQQFLFSRGFIDTQLHLSPKQTVECEFKFQQKNYQIDPKKKNQKKQVIVFGTDLLIKHFYSDFYLSLAQDDDGIQQIQLRKDIHESCFFELTPQRSFQHKGDSITKNSSFAILHSASKTYLGSNIFEIQNMKNKIRMELKSSKILQSYHITRHLSSEQKKVGFKQIDDSVIEQHGPFLRKSIEDRGQLNEQIIKKSPLKRHDSVLEDLDEQEEQKLNLPIQMGREQRKNIVNCSMEKHAHSMWTAELKQQNQNIYLQDNDYIYFASSFKAKGTMVVEQSEDKKQYKIVFSSKQSQNQYECSAIFVVEIEHNDLEGQLIYLKHLITGKYFPFSEKNQKRRLKLIPLLPQSTYQNKLPPFHIYFDGHFFPEEFRQYKSICGFWLNKVDKIPINQILSLESIPHTKWIPYLTQYLDTDRQNKQELLRQFGFLKHIVYNVLNRQQNNTSLYILLFKMINQNRKNRKQMVQYIGQLLKKDNKEMVIDILAQILNSNDNYVQKYIQPMHLHHQLQAFRVEDQYSLTFLRIFRLFCGTFHQPCQRNQNLIYGLFFGQINQDKLISQSYIKVNKTALPDKFKFQLTFGPKKQVKIKQQNAEEKQFQQYSQKVQEYIRQYFYLLADCIKQNKDNIDSFRKTNHYSLDNLLTILQSPHLQHLHGPVINLINVAYLAPEYKYKLYVYYSDYDQMCYQGGLVAIKSKEGNSNIARLLSYITKQKDSIKDQLQHLKLLKQRSKANREEGSRISQQDVIEKENTNIMNYFSSSKFKRYLIMVKHTVQNGYWNDIGQLEMIVNTLSDLYRKKQEKIFSLHQNYSQGHEQKNYMDSTVLIIDIAILYLDLQINLCISNLLSLNQNQISSTIDGFLDQLQQNKLFKKHFDYFHLTEVQNSSMMEKSLILSKKYYEIKSIIYQKYSEAALQRKLTTSFQTQIQFIKSNIVQLKENTNSTLHICQQYLQYCCLDLDLDQLSPQNVLKNGYVLRTLFKCRKVAEEFQNLAHKLGVIDVLKQSIERYLNLLPKEKIHEQQAIYWKVLLLLALIKDNKTLKTQLSIFRSQLIYLLGQDNTSSFIAIDILREIYRDNRSVIVSDRQELRQICLVFVDMMKKDHLVQFSSRNFLNVKINKLLDLISTFLLVQGKRIKVVFPLVLNQLFDKQVLITYICKLKNIDNQHLSKSHSQHQLNVNNHCQLSNNHLFQILLYQLTQNLEQRPQKMQISLPSIQHILDLLILIDRNNLKLTFDIYNLITPQQIHQESIFCDVFRRTLNMLCQICHQQFHPQAHLQSAADKTREFSQYSQDVQTILIYFPILIRIMKVLVQAIDQDKDNSGEMQFMQWESNTHQLQLLEKLFLFNRHLTDRATLKLVDLVRNHQSALQLQDQDIDKLLELSFDFVTIQDILKPPKSLREIHAEKAAKIKPKKRALRRTQSKWGLRTSKNTQILEFIFRASSEPSSVRNIEHFQVSKARQFIKSLTFINKSDKNQLNTQLKTFFLSFLTNLFPFPPSDPQQLQNYHQQLQKQQNILVEYGSAELVSTLLEQQFKQNYTMFINLFNYANNLLQGGNQTVQHNFYSIFLMDHKNTIFENIRIILETSTMSIKFNYHSYPKHQPQQRQNREELIYPQNNSLQAVRERKNNRDIIKKIFRFLQLLCENDNQLLKNYIYQQINEDQVIKYMSVNFLEIAINHFSQLIDTIHYNLRYPFDQEARYSNKDILDDLFDVLLFILDFLIQVCQYPALKNQLFICNTDFFDNISLINQLAQIYGNIYEQNKIILGIQRKMVILLRGLLEQKNKEIIQSLQKKLQVKYFVQFVKLSFQLLQINTRQELIETMTQNHGKLIEQIQNVVDVIIVCNTLDIKLQDEQDLNRQVIDEIRLQIREIEVDFKGKLTTISFCYRPIFNYLSKDIKDFFIKRFSLHQSRNQKLKDVINLRHIINQDILHRKSRKLIVSETSTNFFFHFSIFLCYILVALQLFFFSVNRTGTALDMLQARIINGVAFGQFFTSLVYFVLWGLGVSPTTREKIKEKYNYQAKTDQDQPQPKGPKQYLKESFLLVKQIYFQDNTSIHSVLLLVLSIFGCFFQVRIYCLIILYIFAKIQLLRDILSAISVTWRQLILISLLTLAFNFIFGILSINYFIGAVFENQSIDLDIGHLNAHCSTLMGCVDSLLAQRIIGQTPSRVGDSSHYGRLLSDAIYWAFFDILIPNLTAAIIIDKFAWLRNVKEKIQNEQRNKCLICFADKSTIEKRRQLFEQHKNKKHCIWDYFYYLYYLQKLKISTEYTGVQYWIIKQVKNQQVQWFPLDSTQKEAAGSASIEAIAQAVRKNLHEQQP